MGNFLPILLLSPPKFQNNKIGIVKNDKNDIDKKEIALAKISKNEKNGEIALAKY